MKNKGSSVPPVAQIHSLLWSLLASLCIHGLLLSLNLYPDFMTEEAKPPKYFQATLFNPKLDEASIALQTTEQENDQISNEKIESTVPNEAAPANNVTDSPKPIRESNETKPHFISLPDFSGLGELITLQGKLEVIITVSSAGYPEKIEVLGDSLIPDKLIEPLQQILRGQAYKPATTDGRNVAGKMRIILTTELIPPTE